MIGLSAAAFAALPGPAWADGFFDFFFSGEHRPAPPPSASAYANPSQQVEPFGAQPGRPRTPEPRIDASPAVAYCVRLCDGRYFPIQRSGATPAEICNSFCPASHTRIFSGGSIEHAVAPDGTHYTDLAKAFAYRDKIVPGCTCNGKDAFGLVEMKLADDPTLRRGDVVATTNGFVAYDGGGRHGADFTPIDSARSGLPAQWRRELAQTRITPTNSASDNSVTSSAPTGDAPTTNGLASAHDRRAQVDR